MDSGLRRLGIIIISLLLATRVYATPTTTISIPNTFVAGTTIKAGDTNTNNNEIQNKYNTHSHADITQLGTITSGTWAGTAVGTQFGGTGQDLSASASGAVIYFNGTGTTTTLAKGASGAILVLDQYTLAPNWLTQGTKNQVLQSNGPDLNPSWISAGKVVQTVYQETGTVATGTNTIPSDNTIPQLTEGDTYMTLNFTPISSSDKFRVDVVWNGTNSTASDNLAIDLCQDSILNSLAAVQHQVDGGSRPKPIAFTHWITSGLTTASGATLKVNAGGTAGTMTFNGTGGAQLYGGVYASSITVTEYLPN